MTKANENARHETRGPIRTAAEFLATVVRRFIEDRSVQTSGSLTFTTLLSLVPLVTVALSLTAAFPVFDQAIGALQVYIVEHYLPGAALGWAAKTEKDGRLLARDAASIRLADVYRAFVLDADAQGAEAPQELARLSATFAEHWKHVEGDLALTLKEFAAEESAAQPG